MNNIKPRQARSICFRDLSVLLLVLCFACWSTSTLAQDKKPIKTRISLECQQTGNDQLIVLADLKARPERSYVPLTKSEAKIYALTDSSKTLLSKGISNAKGRVKYIIDLKTNPIKRNDGSYGIEITFDGDETHKSSKRSSEFTPARLDLNVTEESDSIKTLMVQLMTTDTAVSLSNVEIALQVPRMFSNLTIASELTDKEGKVKFSFPNDLPGDEEGMLSIIAKAADTDNFASLHNEMKKKWGIPINVLVEENARELWSPNAPLWMVLTFALLMILVWGHFMVVIYKLIQIRKEGRELSL